MKSGQLWVKGEGTVDIPIWGQFSVRTDEHIIMCHLTDQDEKPGPSCDLDEGDIVSAGLTYADEDDNRSQLVMRISWKVRGIRQISWSLNKR